MGGRQVAPEVVSSLAVSTRVGGTGLGSQNAETNGAEITYARSAGATQVDETVWTRSEGSCRETQRCRITTPVWRTSAPKRTKRKCLLGPGGDHCGRSRRCLGDFHPSTKLHLDGRCQTGLVRRMQVITRLAHLQTQTPNRPGSVKALRAGNSADCEPLARGWRENLLSTAAHERGRKSSLERGIYLPLNASNNLLPKSECFV